jgi:hypothetical protein
MACDFVLVNEHTELLEPESPFERFPATDQENTMADDLKNRGAQDRARVNVNEDHEVRYWTQKWGVSKEQLAAAVKKVGVSADAVARELGKA